MLFRDNLTQVTKILTFEKPSSTTFSFAGTPNFRFSKNSLALNGAVFMVEEILICDPKMLCMIQLIEKPTFSGALHVSLG